MNFNIVYSSMFERELKKLKKKYPSLRSDLAGLIAMLKDNPYSGIPIGKDCYKLRMAIASKAKGKSGGARVKTCVKV